MAQPEGAVPYLTTDHWTGELEGLWTETDARTAGDRLWAHAGEAFQASRQGSLRSLSAAR